MDVKAILIKIGSLLDIFSRLGFSSKHFLILIKCHYICWALSSSTDISSSFIWLFSSSSWELDSSGSSRALPPTEVTMSELGAVAGLGLASVLAAAGLWSDGDWDKVFVEGCEDDEDIQITTVWNST